MDFLCFKQTRKQNSVYLGAKSDGFNNHLSVLPVARRIKQPTKFGLALK